jgi:predicted PilT family ATPase
VQPISDQDAVVTGDEIDIKSEDTYAQNELIKDEVTKHLDQVLQAKMEVKTDNDPTKKVKIGRGEEKKTIVKVIYYKNTNQIEHICHEKNLSLDKVFKDNKDTNFDQYRRIIIK